jgi:hypothetical protein
MEGIYEVCCFDGLRWRDIYIQRFMKIGTGIEAVLRFYLVSLKRCNIGITDGWDL